MLRRVRCVSKLRGMSADGAAVLWVRSQRERASSCGAHFPWSRWGVSRAMSVFFFFEGGDDVTTHALLLCTIVVWRTTRCVRFVCSYSTGHFSTFPLNPVDRDVLFLCWMLHVFVLMWVSVENRKTGVDGWTMMRVRYMSVHVDGKNGFLDKRSNIVCV